MENQSGSVESLLDRVKDYAETRIDLLKLKAVDKASSFISSFASLLIIMMICIVGFLFLNIGIALLLGDLLGKYYYGFFIVTGFYFVTGFILFIFKDKWLKAPVSNMMIKSLLD